MKQLVKTLSIFAILLVAACSPFRYLPDNTDIPETYRDEFKEQKKAYKDVLKDSKDWDFFVDPIEAIPIEELSGRGISGITNWGEQTLLPGDLRQRIRQECRYYVRMRIMDTAAEWDHQDLQKGQLPGKNYSGDGTDVDVNGHSTHVAGIVFGKGFGLAWDLADMGLLEVQPIEVLQDAGRGSFTWVARAGEDYQKEDIQIVKEGGSVIYNGSLGGGSSLVTSVENMLKASTREGIYFVFAAGNNGSYVEYPGKSEYTLGTAALTESMKRAYYSSKGPEVFWAMPGSSINSTYKNGGYAKLSGTSMASPFASAGLAIALSKWGRENLGTYANVKKYFEWICTDISPDGKDDETGWGVAFVQAILDNDPADMPGQPDEPDDPIDPIPDPDPVDPEPSRPYPVDYTFDLGGYTVIWNRSGESTKHTLEIPHIRFTVNDTKEPFYEVEDYVSKTCADFFRNRGMILLEYHDQYDATYWAMRFLFMLRFKEMDISVDEILTSDRKSKSVIYRSDIMDSMVEFVPTYYDKINIQDGTIHRGIGPTKRVIKPDIQNVSTYQN